MIEIDVSSPEHLMIQFQYVYNSRTTRPDQTRLNARSTRLRMNMIQGETWTLWFLIGDIIYMFSTLHPEEVSSWMCSRPSGDIEWTKCLHLLHDVSSDGIVFQVSMIAIYLAILLLSLIVTDPAQSQIRASATSRSVPLFCLCWTSAVLKGRFTWRIQARTFFASAGSLPFACLILSIVWLYIISYPSIL
jgi:hypothetical protein